MKKFIEMLKEAKSSKPMTTQQVANALYKGCLAAGADGTLKPGNVGMSKIAKDIDIGYKRKKPTFDALFKLFKKVAEDNGFKQVALTAEITKMYNNVNTAFEKDNIILRVFKTDRYPSGLSNDKYLDVRINDESSEKAEGKAAELDAIRKGSYYD